MARITLHDKSTGRSITVLEYQARALIERGKGRWVVAPAKPTPPPPESPRKRAAKTAAVPPSVPADPEPTPEPAETVAETDEFEDLPYDQLRALVREQDLDTPSMKRDDLLEALRYRHRAMKAQD